MSKIVEEWRPVLGWEGLYEVSNFGRVRSLPRVVPKKDGKTYTCGGKLLNQFLHHEYFVVRLRYRAEGVIAYVHRLVAEAFVYGFFEGAVVNHKDENTHNNSVDNLEWCTNTYNLHYGNAHAKAWKKIRKQHDESGKPYNNSRSVSQYDMDGNFLRSFISVAEASRTVGIEHSCICAAASGKTMYSKGYKWKYNN